MRKNSDSSDSQSNIFGFRLRPAKPFSSGSISSSAASPDGRQTQNENYDNLMESYRREEDEFLRELDDLRQSSLSSRNSSRNQEIPESPGTQTNRNFVGSFCQLLTYVVQVRSENQRLKEQLFCLSEMREIDAMRADLVLKNSHSTPRLSPVELDVIGGKNYSPRPTGNFVKNPPTVGSGKVSQNFASGQTAIGAKNSTPLGSGVEAEISAAMIRRTTRSSRRSAPYGEESNLTAKMSPKSPEFPPGASSNRDDLTSPIVQSKSTQKSTDLASLSQRSTDFHSASKIAQKSTDFDAQQNYHMASLTLKSTDLHSTAKMTVKSTDFDVQNYHLTGLSQRPKSADLHGVKLTQKSTELRSCGVDTHSVQQGGGEALCDANLPAECQVEMLSTPIVSVTRNSDSDADQPVFSEVKLPDYHKSSAKNRNSRGTISPTSPVSPYCTVTLFEPQSNPEFLSNSTLNEPLMTTSVSSDKPEGKSSRFWNRFSVKSNKKPPDKQLQPDSLEPDEFVYAVQPAKYGCKKAFLKKRKRKISESDSLASSETSGKPYKTIDLPELEKVRKSVSTEIPKSPDLSGSISKQYAKKMEQWEQLKRHSKTDKEIGLSDKGKLLKGSWLSRRASNKLYKFEEPPKSTVSPPAIITTNADGSRYFELSDGRQNTVIHHDYSPVDHLPTDKGTIVPSPPSVRLLRKSLNPTQSGLYNSASDSDLSGDKSAKLPLKLPERNSASSTFLPPISPGKRLTTGKSPSGASLGVDSWANSSDSVFFGSRETDLNRSNEKMLTHVVDLQHKNSELLTELKDKTDEYEKITEQLVDLENEVKSLKDRYKLDYELDGLYSCLMEPNFAPMSLVNDLESQIRQLDENVRTVKTNSYNIQQLSLESQQREQALSTKYLNEFEKIQQANFQKLEERAQEIQSDQEYGDLNLPIEFIPSYEALYKFTLGLLKRLRLYRNKMLEKTFNQSNTDMELLQTQSQLLLAHAQIERQKLELKFLQNKKAIKRTISYHGQDLLQRLVDSELYFYLPFKLHGGHFKRNETDMRDLHFLTEDFPEAEFIRLFDKTNRWSNERRKSPNTRDSLHLPMGVSRYSSSLYDSISSPNSSDTASKSPLKPDRPVSCQLAPKSRLKEPTAKVTVESKLPGYTSKAPQPLKLGNVGQVKAIAAVFDQSELASPPVSPLISSRPVTFESEFNSYRPSKLPQSHYESPPVRQKCRSTEVQRKSYGSGTPKTMLKTPDQFEAKYFRKNPEFTGIPVSKVSRNELAKVPYENVSPMLPQRKMPNSKLSQSHYNTPSVVLRNTSRQMEISTPNCNSSATSSTWSVAKPAENRRKNFLSGSNEFSPVSVRKLVENDKIFSSAKDFDAYVHPDRIRPAERQPETSGNNSSGSVKEEKSKKRRSLLELFKHKK